MPGARKRALLFKAEILPPHGGGSAHNRVLKRVRKNAGWLASSTIFSAIASLIYVALTARALGPTGFGRFAMVMTYGELMTNLAQFQSWKAVVGFGTVHRQGGTPA